MLHYSPATPLSMEPQETAGYICKLGSSQSSQNPPSPTHKAHQ